MNTVTQDYYQLQSIGANRRIVQSPQGSLYAPRAIVFLSPPGEHDVLPHWLLGAPTGMDRCPTKRDCVLVGVEGFQRGMTRLAQLITHATEDRTVDVKRLRVSSVKRDFSSSRWTVDCTEEFVEDGNINYHLYVVDFLPR